MPTKKKKKKTSFDKLTAAQKIESLNRRVRALARARRRRYKPDEEARRERELSYRKQELLGSFRDQAALKLAVALLLSIEKENHESKHPDRIAEAAITYADALVLALVDRPEAVSVAEAERAYDELLALVPSGTTMTDNELADFLRSKAQSQADNAARGANALNVIGDRA